MKMTRRALATLLSVVLVFALIPCVAAAADYSVEAAPGNTVSVTIPYGKVMAIDGSLILSGDQVVTDIAVTAKNLNGESFSTEYKNGRFGYIAATTSDCELTFTFTVAANAVVGATQTITFRYESSENAELPDEPEYKEKTFVIKVVEDKPVVDYTALEAAIKAAQALNKDAYTAESWVKVETALASAIEAKTATEQSVVDAAAKALNDAVAALEKKPVVAAVDYTALEAAIKAAQALKKDDYTAESWAKVETALAKAIEARESDSQAEVDAATNALKAAMDGLEEKSSGNGIIVLFVILALLLAIAIIVLIVYKKKKKTA